MSIDEYMEKEKENREAVLGLSDRGQSAFALAVMALEHGSSSAEAAARLLLSLEDGELFNLQTLVKFDSKNRAHADVVILGCQAHEYWPSQWMVDGGVDGVGIMERLREKWTKQR